MCEKVEDSSLEWIPILRIFSREETNILNDLSQSFITLLSATSADAVVTDDLHNYRAVSINWPDRPPYIVDFVGKATAFRLDVYICNNDVHSCALSVNASVFDQQMKESRVEGELYMLAIVTHLWKNSHIHSRRPPPPPTVEPCNNTLSWSGTSCLPFKHQVEAWQWMRSIEVDVFQGRGAIFHKNIHISGTDWYIDPIQECLTQNPEIRQFQFKGGLLCDGSGLGKTATILGLLEHDENQLDLNEISSKYISHGTLIIVPINLPDQWCGEVRRYLGNHVKLQRLVCKKDLHELTMENLLAADIVITTLSFLRISRPYISAIENEVETQLGEMERRDTRHNRVFRRLMRQENLTIPIVECVHWRRIVVDEVSDFMYNPREWKYIIALPCTVIWGLTATPDLRDHRAHALYAFLKYPDEYTYHPNLLAAIINKLVCGTHGTLDSKPTLNYVQLSIDEQQLFDEQGHSILPIKDTIERLSCGNICSTDMRYLNISGDGNDIESRVMRIRFKRICMLLSRTELSLDNVLSVQRNIERNLNLFVQHNRSAHILCDLQNQLHHVRLLRENNVKEHCEVLQCAIANETQYIKFIHHASKRLTQQTEVCSICLDRLCNCITSCGHLYCTACIYQVLQNDSTCPQCREHMCAGDICAYTPGQVSSKLVYLSRLIRSLSGSTIVFSQWMNTLKTLRAILRDHDRPVWILQGTTQCRSSILHVFSEQGGVLLVCLNQSFAGLHLPQVNTVIFAHPVVERAASVESIERQAVARALRHGNTNSVRVIVLLAPNCDEEILWNKGHSEYPS